MRGAKALAVVSAATLLLMSIGVSSRADDTAVPSPHDSASAATTQKVDSSSSSAAEGYDPGSQPRSDSSSAKTSPVDQSLATSPPANENRAFESATSTSNMGSTRNESHPKKSRNLAVTDGSGSIIETPVLNGCVVSIPITTSAPDSYILDIHDDRILIHSFEWDVTEAGLTTLTWPITESTGTEFEGVVFELYNDEGDYLSSRVYDYPAEVGNSCGQAATAATITLPEYIDSVTAGSTVKVAGEGYLPKTPVTLAFQGSLEVVATVTTDESGSYTTTFVVPTDATLGAHRLTARSWERRPAIAEVNVVAPPGGSVGAPVREGCNISIPVTVTAPGSYTLSIWDDELHLASFGWIASQAELKTFTWQITEIAANETPGIGFKLYSGNDLFLAEAAFEYPDDIGTACMEAATETTISLPDYHDSLITGAKVKVTGTGYLPNTTVALFFQGSFSRVATVTSDDNGSYETTFIVPTEASMGTHLVTARSASRRPASVEVNVVATGGIGTPTLDGCNVSIPVTAPATGTYVLEVWDDGEIVDFIEWVVTEPGLSIQNWQIPGIPGTEDEGVGFVLYSLDDNEFLSTYDYEITDEEGTSCMVDANPVMMYLPDYEDSITLGSTVRVTGTGYLPNTQVTLSFQGITGTLATTTTNANGDYATTFVVPTTTSLGTHQLTARSVNRRLVSREVKVAMSESGTIGNPFRYGCAVSIPVTTTAPGSYAIVVWDDFKVLDTYQWDVSEPGLHTVAWQIKAVARASTPGVNFELYGGEDAFLDTYEYEYPDEVGTYCSNPANTTLKPIDCATPKIFVAQGENATALKVKDYLAGQGVNSPDATYAAWGSSWIGTDYTRRFNAIAYNNRDGFIYGLASAASGSADLVKIGDQGAVQVVGEVKGLPLDHAFSNNGTFNLGTYYFSTEAAKVIYSLDLETLQATAITLSQTWEPADFVQIEGYLWGINGTDMYRLDVRDGKVTVFSVGDLIGGRTYGSGGAVFRYNTGDFGVVSSDIGVETQIHITDPASDNPTFTLVGQTTAPTSGRNDATSCSDVRFNS